MMIFRNYYLGCLAHASYLIGDRETRTAAVVDPQRDIEQYLADAAADGLTIRHVIETHFHADFLSGHLELRARTGATIYYGAKAQAEFPFTPLADGDSIEMGQVRLRALATPGHTPESTSILVYDLEASAELPYAVLTGDTLFIGDVGRPDLMGAQGMSAQDLASQLYDSLHQKLLKLPDETRVYPAHGAGSLCGRALRDERVSTIGHEKQWNYACAPMTREEFVRLTTADLPEAPAYFSFDAQRNREERPTLEAVLKELRPLTLEEADRMVAAGATLLDAREPVEFAASHLRGSINIGLGGKYATWAGSLLDRNRPIVLIASPNREKEAAMRLGRIGFDIAAGYLEGGLDALRDRENRIDRLERIAPADLAMEAGLAAQGGDGQASPLAASAARATPGTYILDVRERGEVVTKRIPGSHWLPLGQLPKRLAQVPRDRDVVIHCASGYRSVIASSLLRQAGFTRVRDLAGGIEGWVHAGLPVETGATPEASPVSPVS
jgi:glyoxylase-like metal-dependent hydrolase (beta-lactamase superfamily II)/rhodanese-related sulfurtransferase